MLTRIQLTETTASPVEGLPVIRRESGFENSLDPYRLFMITIYLTE